MLNKVMARLGVILTPLPLAYLAVAAVIAAIVLWLAADDDTGPVGFHVEITQADGPPPESVTAVGPENAPTASGGTSPRAGDPGRAMADLAGIIPSPVPDEPQARMQRLRVAVRDRTETMVPAPHPDLIEESPLGLMPKVGPKGRQSWQVYARPFDDDDPRPQVAIVIGGLGLGKGVTNQVIQLPGAVTLAFAPYATELDVWLDRARVAGHEVLLELPMEPENLAQNDPGSRALLTTLRPADNVARLDWLLSRFVGYVGVTERMGSQFARSRVHIEPVLEVIKTRGLLYLGNDLHRSEPNRLVAEIASKLDLFYIDSDFELDGQASRHMIERRLIDIEAAARKQGTVVVVGRPYPVTVEMLSNWLPGLAAKGIAVAPVSAVGARRVSG